MTAYQSILITGGNGMLGYALSTALRARGFSPIALSRSECDVSKEDQVRQVFREYKPTLVLNCAAHTAVDACEHEVERAMAINGDGPGILATFSQEYGAKLVHFSTDFVFAGQSARPYRPNDAVAPLSVYGKSKLIGEQSIQKASKLTWLIIRTAWLYGRHGNCFPRIIIQRALGNHPLKVVNDQTGAPTYAVDLAEATMALIDAGATGICHVTNAGQTTWYEFARTILERFSIPGEVSPATSEQWRQMRPGGATRPGYSVLDLSDYMRLTGKSLRQWTSALEDFRVATNNGTDFS